MTFRDLEEIMVIEPIVLPVRGRGYTFPGRISAKSWLQLQLIARKLFVVRTAEDSAATDAEDALVSDEEELMLRSELLGDREDEMVEDGCSREEIRAVFFTLIAHHLYGRDAAESVWERQGERVAPRRADSRKTSAKSARPRGSRAGSTARKTAKGSPGSPSSPTGS